MNRKNLKILSDGLLELIPPTLPTQNIKFDMSRFTEGDEYAKTCNTVGCAVGWAPFFGIKKKDSDSFPTFSDKAFKLGESAWKYLFALEWKYRDNTKRGAGLRIKHYLENGLPKDWEDQLLGRTPLSYL